MIAAYARVSTAHQRDAATIETQIEKIKAYCKWDGIAPDTVAWFRDDGTTGKIPLEERPEGNKLMQAVGSGKVEKRLLVYDLTRLARDSEDGIGACKRLTRRGIVITAVQDGQHYNHSQPSQFNLGIRMLVSENEWEGIRVKMMDARKNLAPQGFWMGGTTPLGFVKVPSSDGRHTRLEMSTLRFPGHELTEADVIRTIFKMAAGGKSCPAIAAHLNERSIPTQAPGIGKRTRVIAPYWRPGRIRNLLINPIFKGELYWGQHVRPARKERPSELILSQKMSG